MGRAPRHALQMAIARRRLDAGLIHRFDQGGQLVGLGFGRAAGKARIARSMGSRGDCFDNARTGGSPETKSASFTIWVKNVIL